MAVAATTGQAISLVEETQLGIVWRRFRKHKLGMFGLIMLTIIVLAVVVVPFLLPFGFNERNPDARLSPVASFAADGRPYLLGTDDMGRDFLTRLLVGGRITLSLALFSTVAVVIVGTVIGTLAGYFGGWIDSALMRFTDLMLSFPLIPMYLIATKMFGLLFPIAVEEGQTFDVVIGVILTMSLVFVLLGWMGLSRQVRASVLTLRSAEFVDAARALGASNARIILRHIVPNAVAPIALAAILAVGDFIIFEAVLSYLGGGIQYPTPSWGNIIRDAQSQVWTIQSFNPLQDIRAYLMFFPGMLILLTVLSINFIGDALRDALSPD